MNILITGSNGFIGKHLTEYLSNNYNIHKLYTPSSRELNLLDEISVDGYIKSNNIDFIIHTANRGGGPDTIDMKNVADYNLRMFFNLAKYEKKVKKIINLGSGAEYCKHKPIVNAKEDDANLQLPLDEYGFYKAIISRYIERSDNIVNLRIFGCYGEYENYRYKFISNAILKNLLHLPITINQNVFFDYIYIKDLIKMISYFIKNDGDYKFYNITRGEKIDLVTLVNLVNEVSSFKSEIRILHDGLNKEYTSNNDRVLKQMGGFSFTTHKKAIGRMMEYYISIINEIDNKEIICDPYLKYCGIMWKGF